MAQIRGQLKRAILNSLARQGANTKATLISILQAYQDLLVSGVKSGRVAEVTTGMGKSVKFHTPVLGEHFTQPDACELTMEYIEVYADSVTALGVQGISSPSDAQILAQMLLDDRLASVNVVLTDYTLVNYPNRF